MDKRLPVTDVHITDPEHSGRLLRGFSDGAPGWKWSAQEFAVSLDSPEDAQGNYLSLEFGLPAELLEQTKQVRISARVNGTALGTKQYDQTGRQAFGHPIPPALLQKSPLEISFTLDKIGKWPDGRAIGLNVVRVAILPVEEKVTSQEMHTRMAREGYGKMLAERNKQIPVTRQRELMRLFHDIPVWRNTWFHNVQIEKNPLDLWMMQQLIYEIQPDFLVETGTWRGGSALYWAHTLNGMGLENSRVITVDIQDATKTAAAHPLWKKYVTFLRGSSTDARIVAQIAALVKDRKVIVALDSDHSMKHVLEELHAYAPMVPSKSYLVVEDSHIDGVPTQPDAGPGPLAAIQKFLAEDGGKQFEQDFTREVFLMTFNPGGWLRRK
ncbi:MAG: class I SAM-dependent methyltransferase [Candidatus Solibacter usitatus]|nr:class I SAM-dependent methyltransferase [Candidatus Solibacter usitatus]